MMTDKSRRAILVNAMVAVMAIAVGAPAALAANKVHLPRKGVVHSGARVRLDSTYAAQAAQAPKAAHDPLESMHQE